jgi:hypothetical protein
MMTMTTPMPEPLPCNPTGMEAMTMADSTLTEALLKEIASLKQTVQTMADTLFATLRPMARLAEMFEQHTRTIDEGHLDQFTAQVEAMILAHQARIIALSEDASLEFEIVQEMIDRLHQEWQAFKQTTASMRQELLTEMKRHLGQDGEMLRELLEHPYLQRLEQFLTESGDDLRQVIAAHNNEIIQQRHESLQNGLDQLCQALRNFRTQRHEADLTWANMLHPEAIAQATPVHIPFWLVEIEDEHGQRERRLIPPARTFQKLDEAYCYYEFVAEEPFQPLIAHLEKSQEKIFQTLSWNTLIQGSELYEQLEEGLEYLAEEELIKDDFISSLKKELKKLLRKCSIVSCGQFIEP